MEGVLTLVNTTYAFAHRYKCSFAARHKGGFVLFWCGTNEGLHKNFLKCISSSLNPFFNVDYLAKYIFIWWVLNPWFIILMLCYMVNLCILCRELIYLFLTLTIRLFFLSLYIVLNLLIQWRILLKIRRKLLSTFPQVHPFKNINALLNCSQLLGVFGTYGWKGGSPMPFMVIYAPWKISPLGITILGL